MLLKNSQTAQLSGSPAPLVPVPSSKKLEKSASAKELESAEKDDQNKESRIKEIVKKTMSPGKKLTLIKKVYGRDLNLARNNESVFGTLKPSGSLKDLKDSSLKY